MDSEQTRECREIAEHVTQTDHGDELVADKSGVVADLGHGEVRARDVPEWDALGGDA